MAFKNITFFFFFFRKLGCSVTVLVIVLQKNTLIGSRKRERRERKKIYFKELTHMTMGAGKSEICRAGRQAGNSPTS